MNRAICIPVLAGMISVTMALVACTETPLPPEPVPQSEDVSQPIPDQTVPPGWAEMLGPISAPTGWQVEPCVNPTLLCVEAEGELVGTVERFSFPLAEVQLATPVDPAASELEFLQTWVAEFYGTMEHDRTLADRTLMFAGASPTVFSVGSLPGLRYGFVITRPDGTLFERSVGYVAIADDRIHIFTAGLINGDYTGTFGDNAQLSAFEPHLDDIIQGLSL